MAETATKLPLKTEEKAAREPSLRAWHPFESLRSEIDRLFDDFSIGWPRLPFTWRWDIEPFWRGREALLRPAVEMTENDKEYKVTAELPGLDEKDIEVVLSDDMITIKGEKKEEKEEKEKGYFLCERHYGAFQRSFPLPQGVDQEEIEASLKKGVLTIRMPKTEEAKKKMRKVEVKAS